MSAVTANSAGMRVVVLGGTSEIALATVRELQRRSPREVALVGRDAEGLERAAQGLRDDGSPRVVTVELDALQLERHAQALEEAFAGLGGADIVILAIGLLGERGGMPADVAGAVDVLQVNAVAGGSLLMRAAARLREGEGAC